MNCSLEMAFPVLEVFDTWLPKEVWQKVVDHSKISLIPLAFVSKQFESLTKNYRPEGCFGKVQWLQYGGDPGIEPPIPLKMILRFDPSKQMLTLIPESINGEPLNLSSIDQFVSKLKKVKSIYRDPLNEFEITDQAVGDFKGHWVLMSKEVLSETQNKNTYEQLQLVKEKGFEFPKLIDTVVSALMHNLITGEFVYPANLEDTKWTYTRVQEFNTNGKSIIVGGFSILGLCVNHSLCFYSSHNPGVACATTSK